MIKRSKGILAALLVATLIATYFAPESQSEVISPTARVNDRARSSSSIVSAPKNAISVRNDEKMQAAADMEITEIVSRDRRDDAYILFETVQWSPPVTKEKAAPVVEQPAIPVVPQAPPLPFKVVGRIIENGKSSVFLQYNEQNLVAKLGDTIAENYLVDELTENTITLRYLPLDQKQTLDLAGGN